MRILRFDLKAYGPFTDKSLDFSGGRPGLHLIYGPNEAGKSTALRALCSFFFGFETQCPDTQIYPYKSLRVGAELESRDGQRLECIRRKANKDSLRGDDDVSVIEEGKLEQMLGGIGKEDFLLRFGIDDKQLSKGGIELVRGEGELGKLLFSAAAGIADFQAIQTELAEQAESLYKKGASIKRINKLLSDRTAINKQRDQCLLSTDDWSKKQQELDDARQEYQRIEDARQEKLRLLARLERIRSAWPDLDARKKLKSDLQAVASARLLPADFAQRHAEVRKRQLLAKNDAADAEDRLRDLKQQQTTCHIPGEILERKAEIEQLVERLGEWSKAVKDRPTLVGRRQEQEQRAKAILQELGRSEDNLLQAGSLQVDVGQRVRIDELVAQHVRVSESCQQSKTLSKKQAKRLEDLERQRAEFPPPRDVELLKEAVRSVAGDKHLPRLIAESQAKVQRIRDKADRQAGSLSPTAGILTEAVRLPVPSPETIERFHVQFEDVQRHIDDLTRRHVEVAEEVRKLEEELLALRGKREVPSRADLQAERLRRDEGWKHVRQAWLVGEFTEAAGKFAQDAEQPKSPEGLAGALERHQARADQTSDRMFDEAEAVAQISGLVGQVQSKKLRQGDLELELSSAQNQRRELDAAWQAAWAAAGIVPTTPREMRAWKNSHDELKRLFDEIEQQAAEESLLIGTARGHADRLAKVLNDSGAAVETDAARFERLLLVAEKSLEKIVRQEEQHRGISTEISLIQAQERETLEQLARSEAELADWQTQWQAATAGLSPRADDPPAAVKAIVAQLTELRAVRHDIERFEERIEGIDREDQRFTQEAQRLADALLPSLADRSPRTIVARLRETLSEAEAGRVQQAELTRQIAAEEARWKKVTGQIKLADQQLELLCQEAGCESADGLHAAEQASARRYELERQLQEREERLNRCAAGADLDEFETEANRQSRDEIVSAIPLLETEIKRLDQARGEQAEQVGKLKSEADAMNGSDEAAALRQDSEEKLAEIRSDAEEYVRLKLASIVLAKAVEAYREKTQSPVLQTASELFAQMTLGSFSGLRPDMDEDGKNVLMGVRAESGASIKVEAMSDGTCDQLYLALRLAMLLEYVKNRSPVPFVVDDILVKFDDDRAAAALESLAEVAKHTQVLVFTHHRHLVDLAQQRFKGTVWEDQLFVHELAAADVPA